MFLVITLALAVQDPVISNYDPPAADEWEQSVQFKCRASTLRIAGYGAARPLDRATEVTVDGRPLGGAQADAMRKDLSVREAAYRLAASCDRRSGAFDLFIYSGAKLENGRIVFKSGSGTIKGGQLDRYTGLQESDVETFWFR